MYPCIYVSTYMHVRIYLCVPAYKYVQCTYVRTYVITYICDCPNKNQPSLHLRFCQLEDP